MAHDTQTFTFDAAPTIVIQACNGDLKVAGQTMEERQVTVVTDDATRTVQGGDQLVIERCDDARFSVPRDTTLVVQRIGGDARVERVAALQIESVGGDLDAHEVDGACVFNRVGGDVRVADIGALALDDVGGDLRLEGAPEGIGREDGDMEFALGHIHGDAKLDGLRGRLRLTRVDGDAALRGAVDGFGPTSIGGDLTLDLRYTPGHEYQLATKGDATVTVAEGANLALQATVYGDISGLEHGRHASDGSNTIRATWGAGAARLSLEVGGDLRVRSATTPAHPSPPTPPTAPERPTPPTPPAGTTAASDDAPPTAPADAKPGAAVTPSEAEAGDTDTALAVLEAVARGELSAAEADDLLSQTSR